MSIHGRLGKATLAVLKKSQTYLSPMRAMCAAMLIMACGCQFAHAERRTTYFHTDALGSIVAASDENGVLLWRKDYAPFGAQLDSTTENEKLAYTGKEHDDITGLTYFGARYYDPQLGRFVSVDPVGFVESNPMSFNRYAYANNNPFKFVDSDGREAVGAAWRQQTSAFFRAMPAPRNKTEAALELSGVALPFAVVAAPFVADAAIAAVANPGTALAITETALAGEALGGGSLIVSGVVVAAAKGLGANPFKGKTAKEIAEMLEKKGYVPKGPDPRRVEAPMSIRRQGVAITLMRAIPNRRVLMSASIGRAICAIHWTRETIQ